MMDFGATAEVDDFERELRKLLEDPERADDKPHIEYWLKQLPWLRRVKRGLGFFCRWLEHRATDKIVATVLAGGTGADRKISPEDEAVFTHCRWLLLEIGIGLKLVYTC